MTVPACSALSRRLFLGSTAATVGTIALTGFTATTAAAAPTGASAWTGSTSGNGWPILAKATAFRIEGSNQAVRLVDGDAATILLHVARRFHYEIDTLRDGGVVGFTPGRPVTQPFESNCLSGTAITIRSICYPLGAHGGFYPRVPAKLVGDPAAGDAEVCATTSWRAPDRFRVCEGALHRL
ncbi:hypothetical protein ATK36_1003 [Amycolatopsis sulphurea]|uniref:Uncharacterized protein n=1 Tax=Amycolatopsis sulphurea TaxID=76022 RepID=A0A2A9G3F3_9PSEU|nr:hypothetical protein [Amycolatopsis sulphurea]PFG57421.1 hypothetical protein ATK36_1003 [Amycolatopsis sulphurea]